MSIFMEMPKPILIPILILKLISIPEPISIPIQKSIPETVSASTLRSKLRC